MSLRGLLDNGSFAVKTKVVDLRAPTRFVMAGCAHGHR